MNRILIVAVTCFGLLQNVGTHAQDDRTMQEVRRYREMLQAGGNPAEFAEMRGEDLWQTRRGPRNATLEQCDLGLGAGQVDGAFAQLPRFFADTGKIQDLDSRLVTCMMTLQGLSFEQATHDWYRSGSDMESLVTYVAARSRGKKIDVVRANAEEQRMYQIGEEIFFYRAGPLDFGCSSCHSLPERRIRLQELPDFVNPASARASLAQWPAYRVSQSMVWSMERRLIDCIRQMRWPEPTYLSDLVIALEIYLQRQANGAELEAPGIKR